MSKENKDRLQVEIELAYQKMQKALAYIERLQS